MSFECSNCNTDFGVSMMGSLGSWKSDDCSPFMEFECLCKECLYSKFQNLLESMDVPINRKKDYRWLSRNLFIRNKNHEHFQQASFYLKAILRK